jgi:hypothetical protein
MRLFKKILLVALVLGAYTSYANEIYKGGFGYSKRSKNFKSSLQTR